MASNSQSSDHFPAEIFRIICGGGEGGRIELKFFKDPEKKRKEEEVLCWHLCVVCGVGGCFGD